MKKKKKKGMTLVEVMASMVIFLIIGVALVGTFSTAFTINAKNRAMANTNANSRAFFELLKSDDCKPLKYSGSEGIQPGYYYISFGDDIELENIVKNLKMYKASGSSTSFEDVKASTAINGSDKYLMAIKVEWNSSEELYKIDNWSWELSNGKLSEVMRRALIAPK